MKNNLSILLNFVTVDLSLNLKDFLQQNELV